MRYLYLLFAVTIVTNTYAKEAYIENKGQVIDQNRVPNSSVLYLYNGSGLNVQLRKTGFSYDVWKSNSDSTTTYNRVDIDFVNPTPLMRAISFERSKDYLNYYTEYTGEKGVTNAHNYKKITYQNVWTYVNIEFELQNNKPKYSFVLYPGAKLSDIKLNIKGANSIAQKNNGLTFFTNLSEIEEAVPNSYYTLDEQKTEVHAKFVKNNDGSYGLNVAENIPVNATLVIDPLPNILWGTYYGGGSSDKLTYSALDKFGNIYVSGATQSTGAIATTGAYQQTLSNNDDAFFAKFNKNGVRYWGTYYGGIGQDIAASVITDTSNKNIYISGSTASTLVFGTSGALQQNFGGGIHDGFLSKFDSSGIRQWSTYFGGTLGDEVFSMAIDSIDNIYIAGYTSSTGLTTTGAYQFLKGSVIDGIIAKFSAGGSLIWSTYYGGNGDDALYDLKIFGNKLFVCGETYSMNLASTSAYQSTIGGSTGSYYDACVAQFDLNGTGLWGSYYGGPTNDHAVALTVDSSGVYIAGYTDCNSGVASTGAQQVTYGGSSYDGFIAKLNLSGTSRIWGSYYGGTGYDQIRDIEFDKTSNLIAIGISNSPNNITTPGTLNPTFNPTFNSFITKFNTNGNLIWGSYYVLVDPLHIEFDNSNDAYLCGSVSTGAIATPGAYQQFHGGGGTDAFLVKFGVCDTGFGTATVNVVFVGGTLQFNATGGSTYSWTGPNGFTSNSANPTITNAQTSHDGIYTVTITDAGGCTSVKQVQVTVNVGVHDIAIGSFSLYPNPNSGLAQIDIDLKQQQKLSVSITDITGRTVYAVNEKTYRVGKSKIELDMHSLTAGSYICRLVNENGHAVWSGKVTTMQ